MQAVFARWMESATFHRVMLVLTFGACIWFAVHGTSAALSPKGSDFTIYYDAGTAVLEGRNPNLVFGFIYLPFFALCMAPIALLPYPLAALLWQAATFAALVWITRALVELVRAAGLPAPRFLAWAPLLCVLRLADSNFGNGQVNVLILLLVVLGARTWISGKERVAGAWIGLAAALKIVPAFLCLAFLARRSWRACAIAGATALACVLLVPAVEPGFKTNLAWLKGFFEQETRPYLHGGDALIERRGYLPGQSLTPVLYGLVTPMPSTVPGKAPARRNLIDLEPETAKWVVRAALAAGLAVLVASLMRSRRTDAPGARLREVSLVICGALTLAPLVHKAHMVWLIVPFALVLAATPRGLSRRARHVRWTAIGLSVALIGLTTPTLFGRTLATTMLSHSAIFFGLQCLFAALLVDTWLGAEPVARQRNAASPVNS